MIQLQLLIIFGVIGLLIGSYFIFRKKLDGKMGLILKIASLVLAVLFFVRYFLSPTSLLKGVVGLKDNNPFNSPFLCFIVCICVWFQMANVVNLTLYPWFKKYDILKNLSKTLGIFASVINICFFSYIMFALTRTHAWTAAGVLFLIEIAICLCLNIYILCTTGFFKMNKKAWIELVVALIVVLIFSIPPYMPCALWGNKGFGKLKDFSLYHRVYLYISFIVLFGIYFLLKRKEKEYCRMALLFIALTTLISYTYEYDFSVFITPTSWPLHLCNTAMFIVPICLIFKTKGLYYFTLFINVIGAFFAMFMPNTAALSGVFSTNIVSFWINHIMAFAMPLLMVLLGVYERPKLKNFIYSMCWFVGYFVLVLILNAWFTGIGTETDFFFVNSDFIAEKLGKGAEALRNVTWDITISGVELTFYPIYQALFFVVYIAIGLAMWFVYAWVWQIQDFYIIAAEKNKKIKLDEIALCVKYGEKKVERCMNKESENKLVVKNVYKQYASSKIYAANDVNIEVSGGEIFGFLGPNGAGKSTIIKCIVGIQPPTKGSIEINGYDIEKQPVQAKAQFGFVPDHYALYEQLTGREYINYIADLYNVSKEDRETRIAKYVKILDLEHSFDNKIRTYSHGMKQKIAIISALVHNPKLWILDEPLTGLDPTSIYQVKECMKEHAKNGNIVFFSSHIIDIVEKLCNRITIIKKGKIRALVTLDELKEKGVGLEQFYLNIINEKEEVAEVVNEDKKMDSKTKKSVKKEDKKEKTVNKSKNKSKK